MYSYMRKQSHNIWNVFWATSFDWIFKDGIEILIVQGKLKLPVMVQNMVGMNVYWGTKAIGVIFVVVSTCEMPKIERRTWKYVLNWG